MRLGNTSVESSLTCRFFSPQKKALHFISDTDDTKLLRLTYRIPSIVDGRFLEVA